MVENNKGLIRKITYIFTLILFSLVVMVTLRDSMDLPAMQIIIDYSILVCFIMFVMLTWAMRRKQKMEEEKDVAT